MPAGNGTRLPFACRRSSGADDKRHMEGSESMRPARAWPHVNQVHAQIERQLTSLFGLGWDESRVLRAALPAALDRLRRCFQGIDNPYFREESGAPRFDLFHSCQYGLLLVYLGHELSSAGQRSLADRVYFLNKSLTGSDIYHEVAIPDVLFIEHAVGVVMGRASYAPGFGIYQNCTVGGNRGKYPTFGRNVMLFAGSMVLGDSHLGDDVFVSAGTLIKDQDVPSGHVVSGRSPHLEFRERPEAWFSERSMFHRALLFEADAAVTQGADS